MEKNSLSDENLKDQAIGLNPGKNLNTAFDSYPVLNVSEYENELGFKGAFGSQRMHCS